MESADKARDAVTRSVLTCFRIHFAPRARAVWLAEPSEAPVIFSDDRMRRLSLDLGELQPLPTVALDDGDRDRFILIDVARLGQQMTVVRRDRLLRALFGMPLAVL